MEMKTHVVQVEPLVMIRKEKVLEADEIAEEVEREVSAVPVARYPAWVSMGFVNTIRKLNCFESVRERVVAGIASLEVARFIQSMNEMTHMKVETIRQYVEHYKATLPAWHLAARQQPKQFLEVKQKTDQAINVLEKMTKLYRLLEERIERGMDQERKFNILTNGFERNFIVAQNILVQIQDLKNKLGVSESAAREALPLHLSQQVDWSRIYARESVTRVMTDPEKRNRVVQFAERLVDMYADKLKPEDMERFRKQKEGTPDEKLSNRNTPPHPVGTS